MPTREEKNTFSNTIIELANNGKMDYLEAIQHYCELHFIEYEVAATLVNDVLKSKLYEEARQYRSINTSGALPI